MRSPAVIPLVQAPTKRRQWGWNVFAIAGFVVIAAILVWQAISAHGNPDPEAKNISATAAMLDTGILVFREGLEAILVLAALTASLVRTDKGYWKPVALGSGLSFGATIITWFIVVAALSSTSFSALQIQAATGLLAIIVLLVIMNWFFHKLYWTGWITMHNRRKRDLVESTGRSGAAVFRGLVLLGFTAVYREGFEVVLFLQGLRLRAGGHVVFEGAMIGLALTAIVAIMIFVLQYRLPFKKMLVLTGVMLGAVLVVMVGESVQEMQQASWLPAHGMGFSMPEWMNTWFAVYPTWESLLLQLGAGALVVGSYVVARRRARGKSEACCVNAESVACETCPIPENGAVK